MIIKNSHPQNRGFTLIEIIVVVVVIAILSAIVMIGYGTWRITIANKEVQSDLQLAVSAMVNAKNFGTGYPTSLPSTFKNSPNVTVSYFSGDSGSFCITGVSTVVPTVTYYVNTTTGLKPFTGSCASGGGGGGGGGGIADGTSIQTVDSTNCPSGSTMVVDTRDNRSYWIKKLADGNCWMLTNLAYAGGGTNTYGDVINLTGAAQYVVPTGANPTTDPTLPSTSTTGTGQYGYLYNFCAALGAQLSTRLCNILTGSLPPPSGTITICPKGWRLPILASGGVTEFNTLNSAINGGSSTNSSGLRSTWLAQYSGIYSGNSFTYGSQGITGAYWIDSANSGSGGMTYNWTFTSTYVNPGSYVTTGGDTFAAVRCLAR